MAGGATPLSSGVVGGGLGAGNDVGDGAVEAGFARGSLGALVAALLALLALFGARVRHDSSGRRLGAVLQRLDDPGWHGARAAGSRSLAGGATEASICGFSPDMRRKTARSFGRRQRLARR